MAFRQISRWTGIYARAAVKANVGSDECPQGINSEVAAVEVVMRDSIDKALLMLKRKLSREGTFGVLGHRERFIKPSDRKREKARLAERRRQKLRRRDGVES